MTKTVVAVAFSVLAPAAAFAHGPQIQLTFDVISGKIITRSIVDTHAAQTSLSDPKSVYVMPLLGTGSTYVVRPDATTSVATGLYSYPGPGISYQYDIANSPSGNLAGTGWALSSLAGTQFSINLLSGLQSWNGASFVDAGTEQLQVGTTITNDGGTGSFTIGTVGSSYSANPHSTVTYTMLGDGVSSTVASDDGVYLLKLQFANTLSGGITSDPFYYVLSKNADFSTLNQAVSYLTTTNGISSASVQIASAVPEPSAMALLGALPLIGLSRRR